VICLDLDKSKIVLLNEGGILIHDLGLLKLEGKNVAAGRLSFATNT
jgi:UDPglucose 6-dehydrogenase